MKKIFSLFCMMLLAVQFASAQQALCVISKSGDLAVYSASKVAFDNDLFTFTYGKVTEVTKVMFSASFSVAFNSDEYKSLKQTPEVGICFSDVNESPTIDDGKMKNGSSLGKYKFGINCLDAGTTYYYRAYVKLNDAVYYGEVQSQTTIGEKYKIINGHKFVDLGLPSGLLWAETNIGAETAADDGNYYAWGETAPHTYTYNWRSYKYGSSYSNLSKYNSSDSKTVLDKDDDAAYVNWGSSCRMPTRKEFSELLNSDNCTWTWTSQTTSSGSSIEGYKVISKTNGSSIFLPASGDRYDYDLQNHGSCGYYWSSTLNSSFSSRAYHLDFGSSYPTWGSYDRYCGGTVRPVAEP